MAEYLERLRVAADRTGTVLCLGLDPDPARLERMFGRGTVDVAEGYLHDLLEALEDAGEWPAALKPNLAWFEQYGSAGLAALERLLDRWRDRGPVILDAKRGDIGSSSEAYARAVYDVWGADAVTVSPWMGRDSVEPFLRRAPDRGAYVLLRTSNPGAADLQGLPTDGGTVSAVLLRKLVEWGTGAVVGATRPEELAEPARLLPLLVPGVGSQGGSAEAVMAALAGTDCRVHRVNVSSAILYAGDGVEAAVAACRRYRQALALR